MKLFLPKIFIFFCPIILFFLLFELIIDDAPLVQFSPVCKKVSEFNQMKDRVEILVFGNSHGDNAIDDSYSPIIFNMANQGQDLKYDLFLFDLIGDIPNIKGIVLTISYFSFEYSEDVIWPYRVRDYLDARQLGSQKNDIFNFKAWLFDHSSLLNYNLSLKSISFYYFERLFSHRKFSSKNQGSLDRDSRFNSKTSFVEDAKNRAIRIQSSYFNTSFEIIAKYLSEIINRCLLLNKKIVFVIPPYHESYNSLFPKEKMLGFQQKLNWLTTIYNIHVLNYAQDTRFEENDELFLNSDHLNKLGATRFTQILLHDLTVLHWI